MGFRAVAGICGLLDVGRTNSTLLSLTLFEQTSKGAVLRLGDAMVQLSPDDLREFGRLCHAMARRIDPSRKSTKTALGSKKETDELSEQGIERLREKEIQRLREYQQGIKDREDELKRAGA